MTQGLIDIHQHVIFRVDDGPKSWEETEAMLAKAVDQGIERIIATSHVFPGRVQSMNMRSRGNGSCRWIPARRFTTLPGR